MVQFPNTSSDPKTVVVKFSYALLTLVAVSSSIGHLKLTNIAKSIWRKLDFLYLFLFLFDFDSLVSIVLNFLTPTTPSWNGHNASGWKEDILAINGFDERMQYGGQDRELGERLVNYGVKSKQIRYSTVCLHLDHPRGYAIPESIKKNKNIRKETQVKLKKWTDFGILKKL